MKDVAWLWMDGELRPWSDGMVHVGTHALHYGTGIFEGVRAYATPRGPGVFRLRDHLARLERSAELYSMELPYGAAEFEAAVWDVIGANGLDACYIRPIAWRGLKELGLYPLDNPVQVAVLVWPWGAYHGDSGLEEGIRTLVSGVRRFDASVMPPQAKACGQYLNSILARLEAERGGCHEAIMLNVHGRVAEGSGENIFVVRDGAIATPPASESILMGITRDTIMRMCADLDIPCAERPVERDELMQADEVFLTGTAAEVTPVRSVDGHELGGRGPVTARLQELYLATVRGEDTPWSALVEYAPEGADARGGDRSGPSA